MRGRPHARCATAVAWVLAATLVVGCATGRSLTHTVGGWLGLGATPPRAYYVGVARAKLYRAPDASAAVVGELALHEGVLRSEVEGDFAYVRAEQSGLSGWVRSANLIDELPRANRPSPAKTPASAETAPAPASAEPTATPESESTEPEPPEPPEKSVFDPY